MTCDVYIITDCEPLMPPGARAFEAAIEVAIVVSKMN